MPLSGALRIPAFGPALSWGQGEGEGETSDSQVRATLGRIEEAILSSDPYSVPASWPGASAWNGDQRHPEEARGVKPKMQRPCICPQIVIAALPFLAGPVEEEAGQLGKLPASPHFLSPFPPCFTFPLRPHHPAPAPSSLSSLRGYSRWPPKCDPYQGRAPPSAGKLCTFLRLPFVLSSGNGRGRRPTAISHLPQSWTSGAFARTFSSFRRRRMSPGTKAATPRPRQPGARWTEPH